MLTIPTSDSQKTPSNKQWINQLKRLFPVLLCSLGLLLGSCSSDSTGPDNGDDGNNGSDEPAEPTFANVQTIFNGSCGGSGCHIDETTYGVRLDGYDNVMESEGDQYEKKVVIAGEPGNSPLIDKIANSNPEHGVRMPKDGTPLSEEKIELIREWISEGAENN